VATPLSSPLVVRVTDRAGVPVGNATVVFAVVAGGGSVQAESNTTGGDGRIRASWILGPAAGEQVVEARVLEVAPPPAPAVFRATASPAAPVQAIAETGDGQTRAAGVALRDSLTVRVLDEYGNGVPGQRVVWTVTVGGGRISPAISNTDELGRVRAQLILGPAPGANAVSAVPGDLEPLVFAATAVAPPAIARVSPTVLEPGQVLEFTGSGFADGFFDTAVSLAGIPAVLIESSPTRVVARVPCVPTGSWTLLLQTHGVRLERPVQSEVAMPLVLDAGGSARVQGPLAGCGEIASPGSYLIAVSRPEPAAPPTEIRIRGVPGGATAAEPGAAAATVGSSPLASRPAGAPLPGLRDMSAHDRILRNTDALMSRARGWRARPASARQTAADRTQVGDTLTIKVPDVLGDPCTVRATARGRVAFAGSRVVILEDINAPLAGEADEVIRELGIGTEEITLPILEEYFGDILDQAEPDVEGRLHILLTPIVNLLPGASGYTSASDFLDPANCGSSNMLPVFYGFVPTDPSAGYGNGLTLTRQNWYRLVRATVAHESKHLIAYATRLSAGAALEDRWLEEGTAMVAEELLARRLFGYGRGGNVSFRESLFCERRPGSTTFPECRDKPLIMLNHFTLLARHLAAIETSSIFGPTAPGDITFYGASWAFLRWVLDHHGPDEAAFLRSLTAEPQLNGTANVAARAGQPFDELFATWVLSLALDDRPDVTPLDVRLTLPSWNLRDIYAGLRQELPLVFPRAYPLVPRAVSAGTFDVRAPGIPAGAAVLLRLDGIGSTRQLIDAVAENAASRVHVVRTN
jgi:hypothetical protein